MLDTTSQRCKDAGYNAITSLEECTTAAKELKLRHKLPLLTAMPSWGNTPSGCYYQEGPLNAGLWFNPWTESSSDGTSHNDKALCSKPDDVLYPTKAGLHTIKSWDGTRLTADSEVPLGGGEKKFPLVVFMNSWAVPEVEYLIKAIEWAKRGYVCVEYQARGWFLSGGEIGTAGPEDIKDVSAVIDWAIKTFPEVDASAIAVGGVSYGGGISFIAAAADPRIKAALVFSGWSDFFQALNWQNTPSQSWGETLIKAGKSTGKEPPIISELLGDILTHENMSFVESWAGLRGAGHYLEQLNANKPAVYMSHQHGDNLFHSSIELDMFEKLECPKHLDLSQGTHASAELLGLIGLDIGRTSANHIWGQALDWLDFYLKGVKNDVPKLPAVQMQLGNDGITSDYVSFSTWPPSSDWSTQSYIVGPRDGPFGSLGLEASNDVGLNDTISFSSTGARMSTGTLLLSDLTKDIVPITANLGKVNPAHAIVYASSAVKESTKICGTPRLSNLRVVPSEQQFQVVTFLYDLDLSTLKGRLITHGTSTVWEEAGAQAGAAFEFPTIDFHTSCWDLTSGHALALGISMYDDIYGPASKTASITFDYASLPSLELPIIGGALPSGHVADAFALV